MSTQPTEAHRELVREMALQGQYLNRSIKHYAQLLADSEARAVEDAVTAIIEKNAPEIAKTNAAFTTLVAERDQLRAEVVLDEDLQAATEKSLKIQTIRAEKAEKLWKEFITLLEITEESDSGHKFNPNKISSCRAMDGKRLNEILIEARKIAF